MRRDHQGVGSSAGAADGQHARAVEPATGGLIGIFILSSAIGISLLWVLIAIAGPWDMLALTRLLDIFIEGGLIQYHDRNPGFIAGIPDVKYYYMSQDPIDWRLVVLAGLFMSLYPALKGVQFDRIARLYGSPGSFGEHVRAYYYGDGLDRFLPFNIGRVGTAMALSKVGVSPDRAAGAVFVSQVFTVFEVSAFAVLGLVLLGWTGWFSQIFWSLLFLAVAYHLVVRKAQITVVPPIKDSARIAGAAIGSLVRQQPIQTVQLCALSILAFASLDVAVYFVMNAFDSAIVLINVPPSVLLMGIVGGYIAARIIPMTPGGIGVWELGFATGLYLGGSDVSLALVGIAFLANVLRIVTSLLMMSIVVMRYDVKTNLREIVRSFTNAEQPPSAQAVLTPTDAQEERAPASA